MIPNKFDEKYDIRLARYDEIEDIMRFIDTHWRKGHIMSRNRELFEHEFVYDNKVLFVIARDKVTNEICGLHGYLAASENKEKFDTWGSIWKVIPGSMGLLGMEIVKRVEKITGTRAFLSIGGNPKTTVPILKKIRRFDDVGKMQHFYCVFPRKNYRIAKINHYEEFKVNESYQVSLRLLPTFSDLEKIFDFSCIENAFPYKDAWYINRRYYDYPINKYLVYGLFESEKAEGLLVCREQEYNGEKVLRIVDYMGKSNLFAGISKFLSDKLKEFEYIDLYCYGFNDEYVRQAGMVELEENDTNIIPNYFAPYVAKNIDIWVGTPKGRAVFFKADGDQDRPN